MDYLNELLLELEFIVERPFPKSQKKLERLQDLFQKKFGAFDKSYGFDNRYETNVSFLRLKMVLLQKD